MDFNLSEEQIMLQKAASNFIEKECPIQMVRDMEVNDTGFSPETWRKMADLGWLGINIPSEYGGSEGSFFDLIILAEEMGRGLLPGPFLSSVALAAQIILRAGSQELKKQLLPEITGGKIITTLALTESGGDFEAKSINVMATRSEDNYVIDGTKNFVPYAHIADSILCVARTEKNTSDGEGITLFLINTESPGVTIEPLSTITGDKQSRVTFNSVVLSKEDIIGRPNHGWAVVEEAISEAAVAEAAYMVGGARWVLDTAVDYARVREQFGTPIGSFQAVQHKCADMLIDVNGAIFMVYYAAWAISENEPEKKITAAEAKAWASDIAPRVAAEGIQIMGGIGVTLEHDMQLYYRRLKSSETAYGDSHYHREKLAHMMTL